MAAGIGKRKREDAQGKNAHVKKTAINPSVNGKRNLNQGQSKPKNGQHGIPQSTTNEVQQPAASETLSIQIVTGSYERVLHGVAATIPRKRLRPRSTSTGSESKEDAVSELDITFSDAFLFAAHASSVRCLALSPSSDSDKRILATGGSDERINLYSLSTIPPKLKSGPSRRPLLGSSAIKNSSNRSLGNLIHHDRAITSLQFPTKSKLFSAAEDNTIAISRVRDWTVLSSIKAPIPKPQGRPSGDTAGPGEIPTGVNDFAIHPSQKLMLSVGRGEKCMRLWNLMTGKKAGVLNFDRELLAQVGEGRHSSGEGRRVLWDETGEMYVVGFERGAVVFGIDSTPKAIIKPSPPTKLHQMRFLPKSNSDKIGEILAASTEDGRILFFNIQTSPEASNTQGLPTCHCVAQLGGPSASINGRIKDFDMLSLPLTASEPQSSWLIIAGSSDGAVRLWHLSANRILDSDSGKDMTPREADKLNTDTDTDTDTVDQISATLIGTLETGNRITCLGAFIMDGRVTTNAEGEDAAQALAALESEGNESEFSELS